MCFTNVNVDYTFCVLNEEPPEILEVYCSNVSSNVMIIDWCTSIKDIVSVTVAVKNISTGIETSVCAEWSGSSVTSTAVHMDHSSTYNVTVIVVLSNCRQSVSSAPHTFHGCGHDFMMSTGFTTIISPQPTNQHSTICIQPKHLHL